MMPEAEELTPIADMVTATMRRILERYWPSDGADRDVIAVHSAMTEAGLNALGREGDRSELPLILLIARELGREACPAPFPSAMLANLALSDAAPTDDAPVLFGFASDTAKLMGRTIEDRLFFPDQAGIAKSLVLILRDCQTAHFKMNDSGVTVRETSILGGSPAHYVDLDGAETNLVSPSAVSLDDLGLIARLIHCTRALGAAEYGFEMVLAYARDRHQFGRPIGAFQAIQHKLADSRIVLDAAALLIDRAGTNWARAGGAPWEGAALAAILFCQARLRRVALETHHCFGAIGFAEEHRAPSQFRLIHADVTRFGGLAVTQRDYAHNLLVRGEADATEPADAPEVAAFRREVRDWLADNWTEADRQENLSRDFSDRHWNLPFARRMGEAGWTTLNWPSEAGGQDRSPIEQLAFAEEMLRANAPDGSTIAGTKLLAPEIIAHGSPQLKEEVLPRLRSGEASACLGYSEPEAGSDLASLRTRAERRGERYLINGQKIWTSDGDRASHMILAARTNSDMQLKHGAISLFVLPMDSPGISVRPMEALHGHIFCNIFFDDVEIPEWMRLGPEGGGWQILNNALASERVVMGAFASQLEELLRRMIGELRSRDGEPDANIGATIADLAAEVSAAKQLSLRSIQRSGGNYTPLVESAMAKVFASELSQRLTECGIDMFGQAAMLDTPEDDAIAVGLIGQLLRRSIMMVVGGGSNEIQRNVIALRGLNLPAR